MIIADTGFWIALINRNDKFHKIAVNILQELQEGLVTTWPVLTETCHLLTTKMSPEVCIKFMNSIGLRTF